MVEAVGAAHKTAILVDAFLSGRPVELPVEPYNHTKGSLETINRAEYADREKIARNQPVLRDAHDRAKDFGEIDPGHTAEEAMAETKRCLSCGCQEVFDCTLRKYATEYQVTQPEPLRLEPLPVSSDHELVIRDPNKCILCGSCVRICAEIQGASALGLTARGYKVVVQPTLGRPLAETPCESCHQCISACPTGALTAVVPHAKPGPFALEKTASVCPECSVGCELSLGTRANLLFAVGSPLDAKVNTGNLCKYGALLMSRLSTMDRVAAPMARVDGALEGTTWEDALGRAAKQIAALRESGNPCEDLAVYVSPRSTTEEATLAARFAAVALRGAPVTGLLPQVVAGLTALQGTSATFIELEDADVVLAIDADMAEQYPVAAIRIRRGVARGGMRFINLAEGQTKLDPLASPDVKLTKQQISALIRAMADYAGAERAGDGKSFAVSAAAARAGVSEEQFVAIADGLLKAHKPVIVVGLDNLAADDAAVVARLVQLAGSASGVVAKTVGLTRAGNAYGLLAAGVGAGGRDSSLHALVADLGASLEAGGFGGLMVAGARGVGASGAEPFVLCIAPFITDEIRKHATVVLPGSTLFETKGSLVNSEGRRQEAGQAVNPPAGRNSAGVLGDLSVRLGYSPEDFASAIAGLDS